MFISNFTNFKIMTRNPNIGSAPIPGYSHIRTLNGYKISSDLKSFYKYMSFRRFDESVDNKELIFVTPIKWIDPFERVYYNVDFSRHGYHANPIACLCVTGHPNTNEEASWRAYTRKGEKAIRVGFDLKKLLRLLENYAAANGYTVYVGKVNYDNSKEDIIKLASISSDLHYHYFPPIMNIEHYLSLMLLKRKAFRYENEIRFFIVKPSLQPFKDDIVKIHCDYANMSIINNVTLEPILPLKSDDIEDKIKYEGTKRENELIIKHIKEKLNCKVVRSGLYSQTAPISIE